MILSDVDKMNTICVCTSVRQWNLDFPHKGPATTKMFPFDSVIIKILRNIKHLNILMIDMTMSWHGNAFRIAVAPFTNMV